VCGAMLRALVMENFLSRTREGVFMRVVASFGLVAWLAAVLSAQAPSSTEKADQNGVHSIRVHVIGCVRGKTEPGRYILTGAFLSGDDTPPTVGTAGKLDSGRTCPSRTALHTMSSAPVSRHTWAMRWKSSASPATRD
jgi:hypothetical protein